MRQKSVDDLLLMGVCCEVLIHNLWIQHSLLNGCDQRGDCAWLLRHQWVMQTVGANGQAGHARQLRKGPAGVPIK